MITQIKVTYTGKGGSAIIDHAEHMHQDELDTILEVQQGQGRPEMQMELITDDMLPVRCSWCGAITGYKAGLSGPSHGVCEFCIQYHPDLQL